MKWTGLNELREKYLSFFESKGHLRLPSFSLVPKNDNSLLLINSGMAPMKKYFTGEITPPSKRVTTCQKCIRTPDIERVGITARHGTYFEMLKSKDLLPLTGYVHGGCSPIGMKKFFPTFIHSTAADFENIFFSAGKIGYQVELSFSDLKKVIRINTADLIKNQEIY